MGALATIERLIVSAQKRLDKFLKEMEDSEAAEALRVATTKATAARSPDQEPEAKQ